MGALTNDYCRWVDACDDRARRGVQQRYCCGCGKWRWDDEACCPGAARETLKEFHASCRRIAKEVRRRHPPLEDRLSEEYRKEFG